MRELTRRHVRLGSRPPARSEIRGVEMFFENPIGRAFDARLTAGSHQRDIFQRWKEIKHTGAGGKGTDA